MFGNKYFFSQRICKLKFRENIDLQHILSTKKVNNLIENFNLCELLNIYQRFEQKNYHLTTFGRPIAILIYLIS